MLDMWQGIKRILVTSLIDSNGNHRYLLSPE